MTRSIVWKRVLVWQRVPWRETQLTVTTVDSEQPGASSDPSVYSSPAPQDKADPQSCLLAAQCPRKSRQPRFSHGACALSFSGELSPKFTPPSRISGEFTGVLRERMTAAPPPPPLLPPPRPPPPCSAGANQWRRKLLPKFQGRVDSAAKRQAKAQYLLAKSAPLPVPAGNPWNIDGEFLFLGGLGGGGSGSGRWRRGGGDGGLNSKGDINDGCHLVCVEASGFVVMTLAAGSDRKTFYWRVHKPASICGDDMPADCTRNKKTSDRRSQR